MVPDGQASWHAGNMLYNLESIGIEHEGHASDTSFPDAMLQASARVAAVMVRKFNIPVDRAQILGHSEVPRATHTDPGPHWPWDAYLDLIRAEVTRGS